MNVKWKESFWCTCFDSLFCLPIMTLQSDGQKMSKRKKNYPDTMEIVRKYGADALRLYLVNSPVVRAENLRFKEEGVKDVVKDLFLPWYNAHRFLMQNIGRLQSVSNAFLFCRNAMQEGPMLSVVCSYILLCRVCGRLILFVFIVKWIRYICI